MPTNNTPLDAPFRPDSPPPQSRALRLFQRISWIIEGVLMLVVLGGMFLKFESWEGGSELLIFGFSALMLLYITMLWAIAGSDTRARGLLSVPYGFVMSFGLSSLLFRWEHWEGFVEMTILSFFALLLGVLATAIGMALRYARSTNRAYYWHILLRLLVLVFLMGPGFLKALWG